MSDDLFSSVRDNMHTQSIHSGQSQPANQPSESKQSSIEPAQSGRQASTAQNKGWLPAIPISTNLEPVMPFLPAMLPKQLSAYVFDVAERQNSNPDFIAVSALCGLASLVGNRIRIAPKQNDDWLIVPNLWGAIVGAPSAMKSPAMKAALAPIYQIERSMHDEWCAEVASLGIDQRLNSLNGKEIDRKARKALKDGDHDMARELLASIDEGAPEASICPRITINDATVEKLGELLNENPRGLLLIRDELPGFLSRIEKEEHASDRAFYLEAFNGDGRFTYDRIGRGTIHIKNCTLSMIGGIQPSKLAPIVSGALNGAGNDGLIQRLQMLVWPDERRDFTYHDRSPCRDALNAYTAVFNGLHELQLGSPDEPTVFRFSPEAQEIFKDWITAMNIETRSGKLSSVLESHILKMPKTVASLALIFELVAGGRFEVQRSALELAILWADYLRSHATRLYSSGSALVEDGARLIIERRDKLPERFTLRHIHQKNWAGLTDIEVVTSSVELLAETRHCRKVEGKTSNLGGRPTDIFCWNPQLKAGTKP